MRGNASGMPSANRRACSQSSIAGIELALVRVELRPGVLRVHRVDPQISRKRRRFDGPAHVGRTGLQPIDHRRNRAAPDLAHGLEVLAPPGPPQHRQEHRVGFGQSARRSGPHRRRSRRWSTAAAAGSRPAGPPTRTPARLSAPRSRSECGRSASARPSPTPRSASRSSGRSVAGSTVPRKPPSRAVGSIDCSAASVAKSAPCPSCSTMRAASSGVDDDDHAERDDGGGRSSATRTCPRRRPSRRPQRWTAPMAARHSRVHQGAPIFRCLPRCVNHRVD